MVINITETQHGNHAGQSGWLTEAAGHDDRLATLADYLLEQPFREKLDFIVSAQSDQMSFHHTDFEDFVTDHLLNGDWEEQRYALLELADQMEGNGRELREIGLASPEYAIPLGMAKAYAAVVAEAEATKKVAIANAYEEIADF